MKTTSLKKLLQKFISSVFIVALLLAAFGENSTLPARAATGGPPNDDFDSAIDITPSLSAYPFTYSVLEGTTAATVSSTDPFIPACNENYGAATVWFKFVAPVSGLITIDTTPAKTNYDSIVALWRYSGGNLSFMGCNDDNFGAVNSVRAKLTALVVKDMEYYIEVVGNYGDYKAAPTSDDLQRFLSATGGGTLDLTVSLKQVQPFGSGTFDDTNPSLKFSGEWIPFSGAGPFGNTLMYSRDPANGNAVNFVFNGTQFFVMYTQNTNRGIVDVYLDGAKLASINQYGTLSWQKIWSSPTLSAGVHYVTLIHASGSIVDIDTLTAGSPTEYPALPPDIVGDLLADTGLLQGTISLQFTAPGDDYKSPGPATGTATSYQIRYNTVPITTANWAASTIYSASVIIPAVAGTLQTVTLYGFTPGATYYFAMIALDEKGNYPRPGGVLGISNTDSGVAQGPQPLGPGTYDDSNAAWTYSGAWSIYNGVDPYASTLHYSANVNDYAEVSITGQQFILTYTGHVNRGDVELSVDGGPVDTISQNNASLSWQKKYLSPTLSAGTHLVRFTHKTGTYVDIDAITVLDAPDTTAPAAITDLSATIIETCKTCPALPSGAIKIIWSAPGGDGWFGTAASYEVRYSLSPITDQTSWDNATAVTKSVPTPAAAGATQSMIITGLFPSTLYYFAIRTRDAFDNVSDFSNTPFASPNSPVPVTAGLYDDAHTSWVYGGTGWQTYSGAGPYASTVHYSNGQDDFAQLTFTGPQFTLFYSANANRGLVDVYVDGKKVDTIDMYNASILWQQQYTSPIFDIGTHTVRLVNASGNIIDIDAIRIPVVVAAGGLYDDTNAAWAYGGTGWLTYNGAGPYNNTLRYSGAVDDFAQLTFNGPQFTLYYTAYSNRGTTDVYIDGVLRDTIDANNASLLWQQPYVSPILSAGVHTVRFVHATGTYVDIDAIRIAPMPVAANKYDDAHSAWSYVGSGWQTYSGVGPYQGTLHYSSAINDYAEIYIAASQFTLTYTGHINRGTVDVYVDGVKVDTLNEYNSSLSWQKQYTNASLSPSVHRVRFVHASGTYIDIDAIDIAPMPLMPGTYDDSAWIYVGNWATYTGAGPYGSTLHYSRNIYDYAALTFNGSQFRIIYTGFINRGNVDVYVDNIKIGTFNEYNSPLVWQKVYVSPVLTPGEHTIGLVHATGVYIDIDAVTILP